jgi:BirA family biotin operon repressor/biotin-[acetyl-CoA-carboxylase] ligase
VEAAALTTLTAFLVGAAVLVVFFAADFLGAAVVRAAFLGADDFAALVAGFFLAGAAFLAVVVFLVAIREYKPHSSCGIGSNCKFAIKRTKLTKMGTKGSQTLFIGRRIVRLDRVDSTNSFLNGMAATGALSEGAVVIAAEQYAGKGQRGASWYAEPGANITLSVLLTPTFLSVKEQFRISEAVAVTTAETLAEFLPDSDIQIKWPNDILINGKKSGGILIENSFKGAVWMQSIAGIGINVNQLEFPGDLNTATSMAKVSGEKYVFDEVMEVLFGKLEAAYLTLRAGKSDEIRSRYFQRLYRYDKSAVYTDFKSVFTATLHDVSSEGRLVLMLETGEERQFDVKEVGFI